VTIQAARGWQRIDLAQGIQDRDSCSRSMGDFHFNEDKNAGVHYQAPTNLCGPSFKRDPFECAIPDPIVVLIRFASAAYNSQTNLVIEFEKRIQTLSGAE